MLKYEMPLSLPRQICLPDTLRGIQCLKDVFPSLSFFLLLALS